MTTTVYNFFSAHESFLNIPLYGWLIWKLFEMENAKQMQGIVFISKFKENHLTERSLCDAVKHLILFLKLWMCLMWGDVLNNISMCEAGPV